MNAIPRPFYAEQALYECFMNSLSLAELAGDLSAAESSALRSAVKEDHPTGSTQVHSLFVSRKQCRPVHWAGALLCRPGNAPGSAVFLFTVTGTLRRFADESALCQALEQQLDDPGQRSELLRLTPLDVRAALITPGALTLDTRQVQSPVMQNVSQGISDFLVSCRVQALASLITLPSLRSVLDTQLSRALAREYPGWLLDFQTIWLRSSRRGEHPTQEDQVTTVSLGTAALDFYLKGELPAADSREFLGLPEGGTHEVETRLVRVLSSATKDLPKRMQAALDTYWQEAGAAQVSPFDHCVARLGDLFYHQTLQALHDQQITREQFGHLQQMFSDVNNNAQVQAARLAVFDPTKGELALSGVFSVFFPKQESPVFSFSAAQGLIKHGTRARFKSWLLSSLRTPATYASIARYIALDQRESLAAMSELRLSVEHISSDVFAACVQSIRTRQSSDFNFLLQQLRAGHVALAAVDHALDVRQLIDPDLLALNSGGRWSSRYVPGASGFTPVPDSPSEVADVLGLKLMNLKAQRDELLRYWPTPYSFALARLQEPMIRAGHGRLDFSCVVIQARDSHTPVRSVMLVDALLERVTGYRPLPLNPQAVEAALQSSSSAEAKLLKTFAGTKVLTVLDQAAMDFSAQFKQRLRGFFFTPYSPQGPDALALRLATLRGVMLRAELRLMHLDNALGSTDRAILNTVLDYPVSDQRPALNQFVPDVHGISLSFNGGQGAMAVANCFLVTERGGLESANAGRAIVWTPAAGFEGFNCLDHCMAHLEALLLSKVRRWELLDNVSTAEQSGVSTYLDGTRYWKVAGQNRWLYLEPIEQDFISQCQIAAINKVLQDIEHVCRLARNTPLSAQAFENTVQSALVAGRAGVMLERVIETARLQQFNTLLPAWLKAAAPDEQQQYAHLLQRFQSAGQADQSYLHDIPEITEFSRAALASRLNTDFPGQGLQPDAIEVVIDTYLGAPVGVGNIPSFLPAATTRTHQSLTQFALNAFYRLNAGTMSLHGHDGRALPALLDAAYVRQLTRQLDIGAQYQTLLKTRLAPGNDGVALRQQQFAEHLRLQVIEQALREKLIDPRKETSWRYLQHVMDMPDGSAREPLDGGTIIIRPFELIAEEGDDPDRVAGVYLIGPAAPEAGPQILWVNYSEQFTFQSYDSDADVLEDLRTSTPMQNLLLSRMSAFTRKTYANGGFVEPHLARYISSPIPGLLLKALPPTLANRPIAGNLFHELYKDNYQLLLQMAAEQSKTTAEANWESFKYLFSLIVQTALMFLPAKLSIPLVVWQSMGALNEGVAAARRGTWGEAVGDFAQALLITATRQRSGKHTEGVTPELAPQAELQPFQVNDVALKDLHRDPSTHVYSDPRSGFNYVQLAGQVFRLKAWRERWRIFIDEQLDGPLLKLDDKQQWVLDTREPLLGGGPVFSRAIMGGYAFTYEMEAIGMDSIQRRFPEKALKIREAHELATIYLQRSQNALHTLNEAGEVNADNRELLEIFFDVEAIDQAMLERLKQTVEPMLARFLHPDMAPLTSSKYVVCRSRFANNTVAFVNLADPSKRVYLAEKFFASVFELPYALNHPYLKQTEPPFAVNQHYRASFLLHEINHQVLNTDDIFYSNPGFPYPDLLDERTAYGSRLKQLCDVAQQCHSPYVEEQRLFQSFNPDTQQWSDIPNGPAKSHVKKIAGVQTLAQAREVFTKDPMKRIDLMLANADTVVLLISRLGRVHPVFAEPPQPM